MRADRLLAIVLLLQTHGRTTARELAQRLEVSERTIYRDLDALGAAGVPLVAESGPGGGCALAENYRTDLTGLTGDELQSLLIAAQGGPLADLGLEGSRRNGTLKLLAALPEQTRRQAEQARLRVHLDMRGWFRVAEPLPLLPVLQTAVWNDLRLRMVYARDGAPESERLIDPLGLVAKINTWYLVAYTEAGLRSFRVARISSAEPTGERFVRPPDFDLARFWAESTDAFRQLLSSFAARLAIERTLLGELAWVVRTTANELAARATPRADGRLELPVEFESLDEAQAFLLRWPDGAEALSPPALRQALHRSASTLLARYVAVAPS